MLVFFVIKIEKIRAHSGVKIDGCVATPFSPSPKYYPLTPHSNLFPDRQEGTTSQVKVEKLSLSKRLGSSEILIRKVGICSRPDCPLIKSLLAKIPSFLPGSGSKVESYVTYRKQRDAYQSTRGHDSPSATIELTHNFASNRVTNRASRETSTRQNRPTESSPHLNILMRERRHV